MITYALLAALVLGAMASGTIWLVWAVLGHDVVQALQSQPITDKLNTHIDHTYRATMNSLVNLVQRLLYSLAGPLVGLLADTASLSVAFMVLGLSIAGFAFVALARLHRLHTFQDRR
jgi:hypothetical protein